MQEKEQKQDPIPELALWESWRHVEDPKCLKRISGGNLNGKTDINPVWRMRRLTEALGPCGFGWFVKEVERWTNECAGEIGAFVKVELRINLGGKWSEPIEGVGGSKLCGKGRGEGLNDEAWKMATTDAISVACKSLGMAADVYLGIQSHNNNDGPDYGTKYEPRNYGQNSTLSSQPGNYTAQGQRAQNRSQSAPPAGQYGPGPVYASSGAPAPQYQSGPVAVPEQPKGRFHIILSTVTTGRCRSIITALSQHDYDDVDDWNAGVRAIYDKYDVDQDAMEEIVARAVEERNNRQQAQVSSRYQDLP